jgi:soluble lytic murein transglycosylase-like protein
VTRFRKTLVPLLVGCAAGMAHAQLDIPDEGMVGRFAPIIDAASRRHGVDGALVHALIFTESSYDPRAVSSQGALGLMQLMPETARRYGVRDALDPAQNIDGGVRMLRELLDLFEDDMALALAAYNAGPGAVIRAGNRIPRYDETLAFVPRVLGFYRAYRHSMETRVADDERFEPDPGGEPLLRAILAPAAEAPMTEPEGP